MELYISFCNLFIILINNKYVNNVLISASNLYDVEDLLQVLRTEFKNKVEEESFSFLGLEMKEEND